MFSILYIAFVKKYIGVNNNNIFVDNVHNLFITVYEQSLVFVKNGQVTDAMLMNASFIYPENTPTTKEAYYYRTIFEKFFPKVWQFLLYIFCPFFDAFLQLY